MISGTSTPSLNTSTVNRNDIFPSLKSDNIDLDDDRFWRNGKYDQRELENVLTGDDIRAKQRVDLVLQAIHKYQPDLDGVRAVGF